jgi:cytochrome c biogenesis factor
MPASHLAHWALRVALLATAAGTALSLRAAWAAMASRWMLFAWATTGMSLVLGGLGAHQALGAGGSWVWDPEDGAPLVLWLLLSAWLHGLEARRRGAAPGRLGLRVGAVLFLLSALVAGLRMVAPARATALALAAGPPLCIAVMALLAASPFLEGRGRPRHAAPFLALAALVTWASLKARVTSPAHLAVVAVASLAFLAQLLRADRRCALAVAHAGVALVVLGTVHASGSEIRDRVLLTAHRPIPWHGHALKLEGHDVLPDGRTRLRVHVLGAGGLWTAFPTLHTAPGTGQRVATPAIGRQPLADVVLIADRYDPGDRTEDRLRFSEGQERSLGPYTVRLEELQFGPLGADELRSLTAVLEVSSAGRTWRIAPVQDGAAVLLEPGSTYAVLFDELDAEGGGIVLAATYPVAARTAEAIVTAAYVPFIDLVWLGSLLATLGGLWSLGQRWRGFARETSPASAPGPGAVPG